MKVLYIYPHPDDESFGPAHAMHKQSRDGHDVHLLTLTRGGVTRQRHKYGYSVSEMGNVRFKEMQAVAETLKLKGMSVLDFPDSGLKDLDPRQLENAVEDEIHRVCPQVVVTYPVHGISGFYDHLVTHAVVKRVFVALKEMVPVLQRLAFISITESQAKNGYFPLHSTPNQEIACIETVDKEDIEAAHRALDCYVTFQETIEKTGIKSYFNREARFQLFLESFHPPLQSLFHQLK